MRIERIRQLIWGVDILIAVAAVACLWILLLDPASKPKYDRPDEWKGRPQATRPVGRQTQPWTAFARVLAFPKDGEKPIIEKPGPDGPGEVLEQSAVARLAQLKSYTRFIPPTDEAIVTLQLTGRTDLVTVRIGQKIPGSVWILVDVGEGKAEFQSEAEPDKKGTLELIATEVVTAGGRIVAGDEPDGAAGRVDPGGAPVRVSGLDARMVGPGRWDLGPREMTYLSEERNIEAIRSSIDAKPWKNPETGNYEGLMIRKVKSNSYVARRGGKAGDILISINGVRVINRDDVVGYVKGRGKDEKQYTLKILRNGVEKTLVYSRPK
jgi:hypothetical protein